MSGVGFLHAEDAWVLSEGPSELTLANVYSGDLGSTMLEQAIGETAGGGPEVDGCFSLDWDVEEPEGVFEFMTAPADETFGGGQLDGIGGADFLARFIGALTIEASEACEDGSLGFFAGIAKPSFDEGEV